MLACVFCLVWATAILAGPAPDGPVAYDGAVAEVTPERAAALDKALTALTAAPDVHTLGVAVLRAGTPTWQGVYGTQAPDVPAGADTLFMVASLTKTVTAQTVLRLAAAGHLSLDAPMAPTWVDPDLRDDPRARLLTPRMVLTHTTGLPNWRFFTESGKLAFVHDPGTTYGYSGEGYQYLMHYVTRKLGRPFEQIVADTVFTPLDMHAAVTVRRADYPRIARPYDAQGVFPGYYCYPGGHCRAEGDSSAAGDMVVSLGDYARFLAASRRDPLLGPARLADRDTLHTEAFRIDCSTYPDLPCAGRVGYGLGWNITEIGDDHLIGHAGTDWASVTLAYWYAHSGDGLVVFINAPNDAGIRTMVDVLTLLDPDSPKLHEYRTRLARIRR